MPRYPLIVHVPSCTLAIVKLICRRTWHCYFVYLQYDEPVEDSLSVENTLWSNTVVASGSALGVVIYTGAETRSVMNTSQPPSKVWIDCLYV